MFYTFPLDKLVSPSKPLRDAPLFHTDRGSEFKNLLIDETLSTFNIGRSLSMKGCPYDNAVAEATFKIIKTEFVSQMTFNSLEHLALEFSDYVNWFNKLRIHVTLGYVSPIEYKRLFLKKHTKISSVDNPNDR
jgi:putative transposase